MSTEEMDKYFIYNAGEIDVLNFEELADGTETEFAESVLDFLNRTSDVEGAALVQKHFARENPAIHTLFTEVYVKTVQAYRIFRYTHHPSEPHLNGMTDNYVPAHQAALITSLPFWKKNKAEYCVPLRMHITSRRNKWQPLQSSIFTAFMNRASKMTLTLFTSSLSLNDLLLVKHNYFSLSW